MARFFSLERVAALAVLAIACWQLLTPPSLGLADNGDFARQMIYFNLTHTPSDWGDRYFSYFNRQYTIDLAEAKKYAARDNVSSEFLFVAAAAALYRPWSGTSFDLLALGALQLIVFVLAIYFLLSATKPFAGPLRATGIILGVFVFTDIAYIAYFNSFYTESAAYIFLLITAGCAYHAMTSSEYRTPWTAAYFLSATAFLMARYQNLVLLPVFLFFGWLLVRRQADYKYFLLYLVSALLACYGGYQFYISSPSNAGEVVLYNSVFDGILLDSPNPREDLQALGLDPDLAKFVGVTAFQPESPRYNRDFLEKFVATVSLGRVARFYVQRPGRLMAALNRTVSLTSHIRPQLGNYEKTVGLPRGTQSRSWAMWSSFRAAVGPGSIWLVLMVCVVHLGLLARMWFRQNDKTGRLNLEWCALMAPMALAQLLLISIFNGVSELDRHAFLFNLFLDFMLVAVGAQLLALLTMRSPATRPAKEAVA
ncbi:MAG: hypothetical protein HY316_09580 [Acidobacteria bacterium]|nr:hypothetical protein [Acidobacteriota bacterium]